MPFLGGGGGGDGVGGRWWRYSLDDASNNCKLRVTPSLLFLSVSHTQMHSHAYTQHTCAYRDILYTPPPFPRNDIVLCYLFSVQISHFVICSPLLRPPGSAYSSLFLWLSNYLLLHLLFPHPPPSFSFPHILPVLSVLLFFMHCYSYFFLCLYTFYSVQELTIHFPFSLKKIIISLHNLFCVITMSKGGNSIKRPE